MKKLLFIALIVFGMNAKAQITLEHTYPQASSGAYYYLQVVHFTTAGYKYEIVDTASNVIALYNLNHSLYKTINIPTQPQPSQYWNIEYVSDELFNTTPTDIEYLITGAYAIPYVYYVRIYDENGVVLFAKDSVTVSTVYGATVRAPIYYTPLGVKMILDCKKCSNNSASIYSLPGILPCNDCSNGIVSGLINSGTRESEMGISNSYPNPTNSTTRIDYTFPNGVDQGEIVFYDLQGKEIKRYKVDRTFDHLLISTADIPAGTYFYQLQTSSQVSAGKKMVVIK